MIEYTHDNPLRVITLFSGYDSQCLALERLKRQYPDFDYTLVAWSEIWRIRKLTPRECFRLMDVDDEDIDKIQAVGIPKTQLYKLYGNSIVVDVLFHIFRKMFVEQQNENKQLELF